MRNSTTQLMVSLLVLGLAAGAARAQDDAAGKRDAWPMYVEDGDRTPPVEGFELVDDLNAIRQIWKFERHMSVGKGLYPGSLKRARAMGIEPFQGGASSPVIADGVVFVSYYKPDGKHAAKREGWRTMGSPQDLRLLPEWFYSVTADDVLVAVDAETGKLLWERVEKGKGLNRLSHKRSHWGVSPAAADGTVFHLGSMGRLYATRIRDGKELWQTPTDPRLEQLRAEHIEDRKLVWDSADRGSLLIAEDVVVIPRGRLLAYDRKTGKKAWQTEQTVQSTYGTPTLWHHDGRTYMLANSGGGQVRLIDPADGNVLWSYDKLGPFLGTMSVTGDLVVLNAGSEKGDEEDGLFSVYRLSTDGMKKLWSLPDEPTYHHHWRPDSGPRQKVCICNGLAYIPLSLKEPPKGLSRQRLIVADALSGKIHTDSPFRSGRQGARPLILEGKILMIHDDAHGDPISASWWTAGKNARQLCGDAGFPHVAITAYCTPIVQPYRDGRIYFRAIDGLVCYDLRKPRNQTDPSLHLRIPGELVGPRGDVEVSLYLTKGRITRGGVRGSAYLHDVDVSKLTWDGQRLGGKLGIDLPGTRKTEYYAVEARLQDDGSLRGTVTLIQQWLAERVKLTGSIRTMQHQPAWQPACDYVLWLEGASLRQDREGKRLLLFVTTRGDEVTRLEAWADQTTKTRPVVYVRELELNGGTLSGRIDVRYRADRWTEPLVRPGEKTAVATYQFEAKLRKGDHDNVGRYTGVYGIQWSQMLRLTGRVED